MFFIQYILIAFSLSQTNPRSSLYPYTPNFLFSLFFSHSLYFKRKKLKVKTNKNHKIKKKGPLCVGLYSWAEACLGVWLIYPMSVHWIELTFSFPAGLNSKYVLATGVSLCSLPHLSTGIFFLLCTGLLYAVNDLSATQKHFFFEKRK